MFKLTAFAAALIASLAEGAPKKPEKRGYFQGLAYQAKTAEDKLKDLWYMCDPEEEAGPNNSENEDTYQVVADDTPYEYLDEFFEQRMNVSTCRRADEMKKNHKKVLHAQGVVGLVEWENLGDHPYTGLFSTGAEGLIRFSESNFAVEEQNGLTPSFAMKFLRDGMESVNMFGAPGFEPSGSWNFFQNVFANHLDVHENELNRETIVLKMAEANKRIGTTGLGEFSRFFQDGTQITNYVPPFVLYYVPSDELYEFMEKFGDGEEMPEEGDFRDQLMEIEEGIMLFEVWAKNQPENHEDHFETMIAKINLTETLTKCQFGDERLFFQHETMRWDLAYDRTWKNHHERIELPTPEELEDIGIDNPTAVFPHDRLEAENLVREAIEEYDCPFAWLIEGLMD